MVYLNDKKTNALIKKYPELIEPEQLRCLCGNLTTSVAGWVSKHYIGISAKFPCSCGRGALFVASDRYSLGRDLLKTLEDE